MKILYSRATTDGELLKDGAIGVADGRFSSDMSGEVLDLTKYTVCPGFIDMHTHGGGGFDSMKATEEELDKLSLHYASCGVATFNATSVTASLDDVVAAIRRTKNVMKKGTSGAVLNGIYLEGPYLNAKCRGAHDESLLRAINIDELKMLVDEGEGAVKVITLAPDLENAAEATRYLRSRGVRVSLGHSPATQDEAKAVIEAGGDIAVHTYNAMAPLNHRNVGLLGMSLIRDDVYNELICDLIHVCPEAIKIVYKCKDKHNIVLITDSMDAANMADGEYMLGTLKVFVKDGVARIENGALAGSTLCSNVALKNVVNTIGIPLETAVLGLTKNPANALGISDIGSLKAGYRAHLTALDDDFNVVLTMVDGKIVYDKR